MPTNRNAALHLRRVTSKGPFLVQPTWLSLRGVSETLFPAFLRLPTAALPSIKPVQDQALDGDGVGQASSMQGQGFCPSQRAQWVGLSSPGWAEALEGERSG